MTAPALQLDLLRGPRQRGRRPPPPSEFKVHCMVADALRRWLSPGWDYTHFPAGEKRSAETGARLKRMGAMPGWPDFVLISPQSVFHGLELKRTARTRPSLAQIEFCERCTRRGTPYAIAVGYREAIAILQEWGAVPMTVRVQ